MKTFIHRKHTVDIERIQIGKKTKRTICWMVVKYPLKISFSFIVPETLLPTVQLS